jgi:hypothetical protein
VGQLEVEAGVLVVLPTSPGDVGPHVGLVRALVLGETDVPVDAEDGILGLYAHLGLVLAYPHDHVGDQLLEGFPDLLLVHLPVRIEVGLAVVHGQALEELQELLVEVRHCLTSSSFLSVRSG